MGKITSGVDNITVSPDAVGYKLALQKHNFVAKRSIKEDGKYFHRLH
jgi:hypothetical protein